MTASAALLNPDYFGMMCDKMSYACSSWRTHFSACSVLHSDYLSPPPPFAAILPDIPTYLLISSYIHLPYSTTFCFFDPALGELIIYLLVPLASISVISLLFSSIELGWALPRGADTVSSILNILHSSIYWFVSALSVRLQLRI